MAIPTITSPPQAQAEVIVNEAFETLDHQVVYGQRQEAHSGLTWGYHGGRWGGNSISDGTLTLSNGTNYVVVARSGGAISTSTSNTNWNNTVDYAHVYQITASGGVVTAVQDHRAGPSGVHGAASSTAPKVIQIAVSDETTALTAGANKIKFRMPYAMTLRAGTAGVRASLTTAQATNGGGGIFTVDINEAGSTILSTKLTIDNTEKTSVTAATPVVISDTALADDAEVTIDIDQIGDGTATGLKVTLIGD